MNKEFFVVDENIFKLYTPSAEAKNLLNEAKRKIKAESTSWITRNAKSLADIALREIANHFTVFSEYFYSDVLTEKNRYQLLQILPTNLPLELTSKIIPDGIFWKRAYHDMWNHDYVDKGRSESWKNAYMQKYLQNYVESLYPNDVNYDEIELIIEMTRSYIFHLNVEQLLTFDIYENPDAEVKHVDLRLILPFLTNLESMSIKSGIKNTGLRFSENLFDLTTADCLNIAESLRSLRNLHKFRINSCNLNKCKMQPILLSLVSLTTLQCVDFSSNDLSDDCFEEIAELLSKLPSLKEMILTNNKIGPHGAQYFAKKLHNYQSLEYVNFRLNFILDSGTIELFKAAANHSVLKTLIMASSRISSESVPSLCDLIITNERIREIDLTCNNLDHSAGEAIAEALQKNTTLQRLDLRMNNIAAREDEKIAEKLALNRKLLRAKCVTSS